MLQHVPTIKSISPSSSGMLGGAKLTISGDSFTLDKSASEVVVSGIKCEVEVVSITKIICVLGAAAVAGPALTPGTKQPGARGVDRLLWYHQTSRWDESSLLDASSLPAPDVNDTTLQFFESVERGADFQTNALGNFRGFFRPPVTGTYTLVANADDRAVVWIASTPCNSSREALEKVASVTVNQIDRHFDKMFPKYHQFEWFNPLDRVLYDNSRRSRKLELQKGSAYFMEAWYANSGGGGNFGVAAVLHKTDLNQKDKPAAIDEKQLISLRVESQYALYNFSMRGSNGSQATGQFKLRLGNKESRPIPATASREHMAAVLRELLSNCQVTFPSAADKTLEHDSSGSATDCRLGTGTEYRGLKSTTEVCEPASLSRRAVALCPCLRV
jgi:hypothetical protein